MCHGDPVFRTLAVLAGLSLATDLGTGAPLEESLKRCVVATRLARAVGCTEAEVGDVLYTALLQHLGCTAYSHETAGVWGDDVVATRLAFLTDFSDPKDVLRTFVPGLAAATGTSRPRVVVTTVAAGRRFSTAGPTATCEVARDAARQLGLPVSVQDGLFHGMAMWNGKGVPAVAGPAIPASCRIMQVAATAVLFAVHAGAEAAIAEVRRRAGSYLDPDLAAAFVDRAAELLAGLDHIDAYECVLDSEPDPVRLVDGAESEALARTFGHLVDLKSPYLHGHSAGVGDLAAAAGQQLRMDEQVRTLRIAGYLHDVGRAGVSSRIWDKPGPLSVAERDQARLHPYHSERVLSRVPQLAEVAKLAGQHHERCDGSGYHRGAMAAQLSTASRVLAAADAYRTLVEGRPHRPALSAEQAAERLRAGARAGCLDGEVLAGVLQAAGLTGGARRARPSGLTRRQIQVLRLMAEGLSNRDIARRLVISPRTAEHHVQDIYVRIGATSRAAAALYGMEHGLLDKPG
jgi:HD-GYP domain-containing protein (c-di-GMP phosphodiesterase class II)/DNA-binding CsgD family transcriptional regulator